MVLARRPRPSAWPSCATCTPPSGPPPLAALQGGVEDEDAAAVTHGLQRLEAALRARTALGFD